MAYSSRDPSTTTHPHKQDGQHQPTMAATIVQASFIVGGRPSMDLGCPICVGNPYFTHTFEALTAKVRVTGLPVKTRSDELSG